MDRPSSPSQPAPESEMKAAQRARAEEILRQLGGQMFLRMTGARDLAFDSHGLRFSLDDDFAAQGINRVQVALDASDTYTLRGWVVDTLAVLASEDPMGLLEAQSAPIAEESGLYFDQLPAAFERMTGLRTSL